jgi:hypothetical protein
VELVKWFWSLPSLEWRKKLAIRRGPIFVRGKEKKVSLGGV